MSSISLLWHGDMKNVSVKIYVLCICRVYSCYIDTAWRSIAVAATRLSVDHLSFHLLLCSQSLSSFNRRWAWCCFRLILWRRRTRKPCYRKDDRAMRPIYGCPEKFPESSQTPPATFPEICKRLLLRSILRMCIQNLKFVALSVSEIIGGTQKI